MKLAIESPAQPDILELIDALDAYQKPLYPAESHHGIDIDTLKQPNVIFAVARDTAGTAFACGAIVLNPEWGEIKRMFVSPAARGSGAGKAILKFVEDAAAERGCRLFRLETGIYQAEALGLYERAGYRRREPFGDYVEDPMSVFMEKRI
jgi:putative acetyltransferase